MHSRYKLAPKGKAMHIMVRKGAGAATDAGWVSLGGCTSHVVAMRVYLALLTRGGR